MGAWSYLFKSCDAIIITIIIISSFFIVIFVSLLSSSLFTESKILKGHIHFWRWANSCRDLFTQFQAEKTYNQLTGGKTQTYLNISNQANLTVL